MLGSGDGGFGTWWLILSIVIFVLGVAYIYRPWAKRKMDDAAHIPLREDD